jgi:hypothetical protein
MPRIFDNIEQHLSTALAGSLSKAYRADFCVGYFNLRGWKTLDAEIEKFAGENPSEFKVVFTNSAVEATALASAFNSNLFYWYLTVFSDCRHVNKREIDAFPVGWINSGDSMAGVEKIATIGAALMEDLWNNSEDRQMTFKHDTLTVQCIISKKSKPILDEIDKVLAEHYGFTDEELETIINYDIKYRMGKDLQEDGSEE